MGPITDRTAELLAPTDVAIVRARRRLLELAQSLARGGTPVGLEPSAHRVRSASFVSESDSLADAVREAGLSVEAGTAHVSI
jgi:hypothetical protein